MNNYINGNSNTNKTKSQLGTFFFFDWIRRYKYNERRKKKEIIQWARMSYHNRKKKGGRILHFLIYIYIYIQIFG